MFLTVFIGKNPNELQSSDDFHALVLSEVWVIKDVRLQQSSESNGKKEAPK